MSDKSISSPGIFKRVGIWARDHKIAAAVILLLFIPFIIGFFFGDDEEVKELTLKERRKIAASVIADLVPVEGGTFTMGSADPSVPDSEKPAHQVTLSDFRIGAHQITYRQYFAVVNGSYPQELGEQSLNDIYTTDDPEDINKFLANLKTLTGVEAGIPSEAQWEYAARGGKKSKGYKYAGGNDPEKFARFSTGALGLGTNDPSENRANELGLYGMCGGVSDYVWENSYKYSAEAQTDPYIESDGAPLLRGGDCFDGKEDCRITSRKEWREPHRGHLFPQNSGFRIAADY